MKEHSFVWEHSRQYFLLQIVQLRFSLALVYTRAFLLGPQAATRRIQMWSNKTFITTMKCTIKLTQTFPVTIQALPRADHLPVPGILPPWLYLQMIWLFLSTHNISNLHAEGRFC